MRLKYLFLALILIFVPADVFAGEAATAFDSGLIWLVNGDNRLGENYVPAGMETYQGFSMRPELIEPFEQMLEAMKADGVTGMYIQSAYRDYGHQAYLFSQKKAHYINQGHNEAEAEEYAARSVARPGASEHQSGLALDVTVDGQLRQTFGETEQGKWLAENCQRFGFVIRYPQDKTEITQIIYEPWHIRYVGVPHAAFMKEKNLCLEEYMDYLAENEKCIYWLEDGESYYLITNFDSREAAARVNAALSSDRPGEAARYITTELKRLVK